MCRVAFLDANPEAVEQVPPPLSRTTPPPQPHPDPKASRVSTHSGGTGEDDDNISDTDESDKAFTHYGYNSNPNLLPALAQSATRSSADARRIRFIDTPGPDEPAQTKTLAKVGKKECKWVDTHTTMAQQCTPPMPDGPK